MRYKIYLDVLLLHTFAMDALALLLVRRLNHPQEKRVRMFLSAGFGAAGSAILFLRLCSFRWYQLSVHLLINPLMILLAFGRRGKKEFAKDLGWTYALMFLLGGVLSWGMETLGQRRVFWIWALGGLALGCLLVYGIGRQRESSWRYEILLLTGEEKLILSGYLDTGNLLIDPTVHQPVHIIQEELLDEILKKEQLPLRYIPFHSLGQAEGLLPVVTLRAMYLRQSKGRKEQTPVFVERPVFGLAKEKLFEHRDYQVILNASCNWQ